MVRVLAQITLPVRFARFALTKHAVKPPELLQVEVARGEIEDAIRHAREELCALCSILSVLNFRLHIPGNHCVLA